MRADRLLSILMILQTRGKVTAGELSKECEVSERTIYRDINALCIAGVPVYSETGPQGGFALIENYRTTLTGLTEGEVRALFMLSIPAPLTDLGVGQELRAALLKLSASLPNFRRRDEEKIRQSFYLDSTWWRQGGDKLPFLREIQQAVWQNRKLFVAYNSPYAEEIRSLIAPYGLVAKAGVWYLVCARNEIMNVHRVSHLLSVHASDETFERPLDFNLQEFWEAWCCDYENYLTDFIAIVRVAKDFISELPRYFGNEILARIAEAKPDNIEGWIEIELAFESFESARERILGFGRGVEVLEPLALRLSVFDYAEQTTGLYKT